MVDDVERDMNLPEEDERGGEPVGAPEAITGYGVTSPDASKETLDRGLWDTYQLGYLDGMRDFIRSQNPFMQYVFEGNTAIQVGDRVPTHKTTPNEEHGGWIPLRNGFFAGWSMQIEEPMTLTDVQGLKLRIYRNNVAATGVLLITGMANLADINGTALGVIKAEEYNINPSGRLPREEQDVHEFRAGEEIELICEAHDIEFLSLPNTIKDFHVYLYYTFDATNRDTLSARRFGGGQPGGESVPGGGDDGGGGIIV